MGYCSKIFQTFPDKHRIAYQPPLFRPGSTKRIALIPYPTVPVAWVPFPDMCGAGVLGYEVSITGNIVNGQAIAAQIGVSAQFGLEGSQGYIESIDIADGSFKISGGPRVRINDPEGIFGKATTGFPLFLSDGENPSVTAFSGYPMCIPRSEDDEKCPQGNRPAGNVLNFQPQLDPLKMVPFRVGDFIEYNGLKVGDEILAYVVTAINVQVTTTASNTVPNYIRVEDALIGVFDTVANVETADIRVDNSNPPFSYSLTLSSLSDTFQVVLEHLSLLVPLTSTHAQEMRSID